MADRMRYAPNRAFVYVVGAAVALQVWHALPESPAGGDTAAVERAIYGDARELPISDVRCARVSREAANCIITLPGAMSRARVRARIDERSGAVSWAVVDSLPAVGEVLR